MAAVLGFAAALTAGFAAGCGALTALDTSGTGDAGFDAADPPLDEDATVDAPVGDAGRADAADAADAKDGAPPLPRTPCIPDGVLPPDASLPDAEAPEAGDAGDAGAEDAGDADELDGGPERDAGEDDADAGDAAADAGTCAPRRVVLFDFNQNPALTYGGATPDTWAIGKSGLRHGPEFDRRFAPGQCYLATHPGEPYEPSEDAWVELPRVDLSSAAGCSVEASMWIWYELEGLFDAANLVVAKDDGPFENVAVELDASLYNTDDFKGPQCNPARCSIYGQSCWSSFAPGTKEWRRASFDLSRFAGSANVRLRFQFHSDDGGHYDGMYIQDVDVRVP